MTSLRKRLRELHGSNVLIFSVPFRHDLTVTSCVNKHVQEVNASIERLCKYFKKCKFVNISYLGKRFHTRQGLHLNYLGKKFVGQKIVENVHEYLRNKYTSCLPVIPLQDVSHDFLGVQKQS